MDTIVEMLATLVVAMAVAALSLFGVKIDAPHATAPKPPVISRTANTTPVTTPVTGPAAAPQEAAKATPAQPMAADCPKKKIAAASTKA